MLSLHSRRALSSLSLLIGALLIGSGLNGSVVTGTYGVLSPPAVLRILPGILLVYVGSRLQLTPEYVDEQLEREPSPDEPEEESFDPEMSPIGDSMQEVDGERARGDGEEVRGNPDDSTGE